MANEKDLQHPSPGRESIEARAMVFTYSEGYRIPALSDFRLTFEPAILLRRRIRTQQIKYAQLKLARLTKGGRRDKLILNENGTSKGSGSRFTTTPSEPTSLSSDDEAEINQDFARAWRPW